MTDAASIAPATLDAAAALERALGVAAGPTLAGLAPGFDRGTRA